MPITGKLTVTELRARYAAGGADALMPYAPAILVYPGYDGLTDVSWAYSTDSLNVKPETPASSVEADGVPSLLPGNAVVIPLFIGDKDAAIVGRDDACDVCLSSSNVSRRHATIVRSGKHYIILDLGSSNGTRVDGLWLKNGVTYNLGAGRSVEFADVGTIFLDMAGLVDVCRDG